jgi:hypothetical protein
MPIERNSGLGRCGGDRMIEEFAAHRWMQLSIHHASIHFDRSNKTIEIEILEITP